jgi:mRNA interferase RelE/StbE
MYSVEITNRAHKEFKKLGSDVQKRVLAAMKALGRDPIPDSAKQLSGNPMPDEEAETFYRIRVGDYRVIYTIEEARLLVLVVRVRHRRDAYR